MSDEEQPKRGLFGRLFRKEEDAAEELEFPVGEDSADPVESGLDELSAEDAVPRSGETEGPDSESPGAEEPAEDTPVKRGLFSRVFGRREEEPREGEGGAEAESSPDAGDVPAEAEGRVEPEPPAEPVVEEEAILEEPPDEAFSPAGAEEAPEEGEGASPGLLGRLFGRREQDSPPEGEASGEDSDAAAAAVDAAPPKPVEEEPAPVSPPTEVAGHGEELYDEDAPTGEPEAPDDVVPAGEDGESRGLFGRLRTGLTKTRKGLVQKVDRILLGKKEIDGDTLEELEEALVTADLGVHTSLRLIQGIQEKVSRKELTRPDALREHLRSEIRDILVADEGHFELGGERPQVLMVVGVNGVGKTTTIGKLAAQYSARGHKVLLAAGDTFRAAAIEQLQIWGKRVGAQVVRHQDGSDPAAVAFDAVAAAKARGADLVIVDTAGRLHTKSNLMEELKKVQRVIGKAMPGAPHQVLLVLDATTGQNAINQAKIFRDAVGVDGIALTKLDGTAKGGVIVGICDELKIPVQFIGIGEQVDDLRPFDADEFVEALF